MVFTIGPPETCGHEPKVLCDGLLVYLRSQPLGENDMDTRAYKLTLLEFREESGSRITFRESSYTTAELLRDIRPAYSIKAGSSDSRVRVGGTIRSVLSDVGRIRARLCGQGEFLEDEVDGSTTAGCLANHLPESVRDMYRCGDPEDSRYLPRCSGDHYIHVQAPSDARVRWERRDPHESSYVQDFLLSPMHMRMNSRMYGLKLGLGRCMSASSSACVTSGLS